MFNLFKKKEKKNEDKLFNMLMLLADKAEDISYIGNNFLNVGNVELFSYHKSYTPNKCTHLIYYTESNKVNVEIHQNFTDFLIEINVIIEKLENVTINTLSGSKKCFKILYTNEDTVEIKPTITSNNNLSVKDITDTLYNISKTLDELSYNVISLEVEHEEGVDQLRYGNWE